MTEFTFLALLARPLLEKFAQNGFRIDSKGYLLRLNGFEECCGFGFSCLCRGFFLFFLFLQRLFALVFG